MWKNMTCEDMAAELRFVITARLSLECNGQSAHKISPRLPRNSPRIID